MLVKPLLAGYVVPNDGWTHAQLRDVSTQAPDGTIHDNDTLLAELTRNTPFKDAIFCLVPHWQGSAFTVSHSEKTTVSMAFVDESGAVSAAAVAAGTFMFNSCCRLIITGDSPSIVMCGRCHRIGHATNTPACPLPANGVRCVRCGGAHHSDKHAAFCTGPHPTAGVCNCFFTCLNCHGKHGTRAAACPLKKGFAPPPMVPLVDPSIVPPPAPSAKGKGKAVAPPPPEDLVPTQREPGLGVSKGKRQGGQGGRSGNARRAEKLTSSVPARPLTSSSAPPAKASTAAHFAPPPLPDWKDTPTIGEPHVATAAETFEAIARITINSTDTTRNKDLMVICGDWNLKVVDEDAYSALGASIPFRFAVKYRLPLTAQGTVSALTKGKSISAGREALIAFNNTWSEVSPFFYTLSKLDADHSQSFILPGEILDTPPDPELERKRIECATALINSCIAVQQFTTPNDPITISLDTVRGVATSYTDLSFIRTRQEDLWEILVAYQKSTSASLSDLHA
ncbi:hypothetical protein EDB84DRAFT_1560627 [Lactarius hengduanensis]|nr:hypothetical protein EDB84DRAFT_1560627 [Lactarius hengduanensis]